MLVKQNISWPARQIKAMIEKGSIDFNLYFQRNDVWTIEQRSLLIQSMLEGYAIPPIYSNKNTSRKVYEFLDGRQRSTTWLMYMQDKFALKNVAFFDKEYNQYYDLNGMKYSDLSEDFQNRIRDCQMTIFYYDDLTEDEQLEMFRRLNNGTPLTVYQNARSSCPSLKELIDLSKHKIFTDSFTDKSLNAMKNEHMIVKFYIMLNEGKPCLDRRKVDKYMRTLTLDEDDKAMITSVLDRMYDAYQMIQNDKRDMTLNKKICRKITSLTSMPTLVPLTYQTLEDDISVEEYAEFLQVFFGNSDKGASVSKIYNDACLSGSGHEESVKARVDEINKAWEEFHSHYKATAA